MGTARRIGKNALYLGTAEVISRILQFMVMLYAARLLSQQSFGKFSFAVSLSFIAVILADLGINTLIVREIARNKSLASKYFVNAFSIKILLSIIAFLVVAFVLNALSYPPDTREIVYVIWLFTILSTFTELFYSIFRAFEVMFYDALLKILRMVILAITSIYVLFKGYGVVVFGYTFILAEIIVVLMAFLIAFTKFIKIKMEVDWPFIKILLKSALPFGMAFIFGSIYFFIGSIILSKIKGDAEVAIFSAAYNIILALLFIPTVYTNAIYPVLSRYYHQSKPELRLLYERSFKYLYIIGIPVSIGIFMLSKDILNFLYGAKYAAAAIALQIISLYLFLKFINFLMGTVLSSIDQQNKRMLGQGVTAVLNVMLNLLLIPSIGFAGAALATLITEIFLFVIYYMFVSRSWYYYNFISMMVKPLIAVIFMSLFIHFTNLGLMATILASGVIYFAAIFILRILDNEDYRIINKILKNEAQ